MVIKIAQLGVGHAHAAGKMEVYRASPDYEVLGVCEPDPVARRRAEGVKTYQGLKWLTQEQLLNLPGLQAVAVETQVKDLLRAAEVCIAAGKHVHLDKPAGSSLPQFKRILDVAAAKHLQVQLGYMFRYNPSCMLLRRFLKDGWLGEPFEVHAVMSKVVPQETRRELAEYPGGMMFELGCHVIDSVVSVLGRPTKVTAYRQHAANIDDSLADNMLAVFEYPKALATVKSSAMDVEGFARRQLSVCGSEGTFHIQPLDDSQATIALSKARGPYKKGLQSLPPTPYSRYVGDAADLAKIIREEKESDFSYAHELAVQETVLLASGLPIA